MGYRLVIAVCSLVLVCSCAAFDKDEDAIEGFGDKDTKEIPSVAKDQGPLTGYYAGSMILDSNTCQSISDEVGTESRLNIDVAQKGSTLNVTFDDGSTASGVVDSNKAVIMTTVMEVKHIYYVTFAEKEGTVSGDCEVVETGEDGQYGSACATYTINLTKGEKPAAPEEGSAAKEGEGEEEKK